MDPCQTYRQTEASPETNLTLSTTMDHPIAHQDMMMMMTTTTATTMDTTTTTTSSSSSLILASATPALTEFHLFPYLPAELRLLIWRLSLRPRVVTLTSLTLPLSSPTRPPITFSVSRESRSESLRFYVSLSPKIFFHPSLDTLYIPRSSGGFLGYSDSARDFSLLKIPGVDRVERVAVDFVSPEIRKEWEAYSKFCLLQGFRGLREAGLVIGTELELGGGGSGGGSGSNDDGHNKRRRGKEVGLREPTGDKEGVVRIMEIVRESFRVEGVGEDGKRWEVEEGIARDEWGKFEIDTGLELRPLVRVVRA